MPNRIIKESICYSADIDRLTSFEETVFYRILVRADDYGNLDARPDFLKSVLFTTKPGIGVKRIVDACRKLCEVGLIRGYEVEGKPYLNVVSWRKHQRLRNKHGKVPPPVADCGKLRQLAADCGKLRPEQELEPELELEPEPELPELFERFWRAYPKKLGKRDAFFVFCEMAPNEALVERMIQAIEQKKGQEAWMKENGRFIPKAEKWLSEEQWEEFSGGETYGAVV